MFKIFETKKVNIVATWAWDIINDTCAICKLSINDDCIICSQNNSDECYPTWGRCNHAFHFHCISQWIKSKNTCPLDNSPWEYNNI